MELSGIKKGMYFLRVRIEGKYLVKVWLEELPPWCVLPDPFNEKIVTIGNFHDVAITSLSALDTIEKGEYLFIETVVKNVATYNETNTQVKATIKKNGNDPPVWQQTITTLQAPSETKLKNDAIASFT